jgi:CMP-2-keto-3-deoxyoctulosonic acid synthetase
MYINETDQVLQYTTRNSRLTKFYERRTLSKREALEHLKSLYKNILEEVKIVSISPIGSIDIEILYQSSSFLTQEKNSSK